MKKFLVFILLLGCLVSTMLFKFNKNPLFSLSGVEKACLVLDCEIDGENVETVFCGDLVFNFCSLQTARQTLQDMKEDVKALQLYFSDLNVCDLISKLKGVIVSTSEVDEMTIFLAYTPYYQDCIFVDGKKVNLQIACSGESVIAGFPAILTGF